MSAFLTRIKRITSHTGHARYIAECSEDAVGFILRQTDIPSPYRYSPEWNVFQHESGKYIVIVETAHKRFDVYEVPKDIILGFTGEGAQA